MKQGRPFSEDKKGILYIFFGIHTANVVQLADSGVILRIIAYCGEEDRIQLERDLNREIKLMCERWQISIPFPQVVLNEPDSFTNLPEPPKQDERRNG